MWLTHSAPGPGRVVAVLRLEVLGRRGGELAQRLDGGGAGDDLVLHVLRQLGGGRVARDLALDGVDRLLRRREPVLAQEVLGRLPGDDLGEPAAGRGPVDGDVGPAGEVEQAGVGGEGLEVALEVRPADGRAVHRRRPRRHGAAGRQADGQRRRHRERQRPTRETGADVRREHWSPRSRRRPYLRRRWRASWRPPAVSGNSSPRTASRWRVGSWPRRKGSTSWWSGSL